ncbi:CHAP domain-containing protein [Siccirubricoccus deserti]|nr:CHAP domain-containing protein [Siccirubricoccus deserti]
MKDGDTMRVKGAALAFCVLIGATAPGAKAAPEQSGSTKAERAAAQRQHRATTPRTAARPAARAMLHRVSHRPPHTTATYAGISCVPYARAVSGIQVTGNGGQWWHNAAGLYARSQRPEPGAVMAFRSSGGMSRGHVAVVRQILGPRELLIDHANWAGPGIRRGSIMQNVMVVDVSDRNDWTAVKVQVGHDQSSFGRTYPIYGFIHNRPDTETVFAGLPSRRTDRFEQVAEMPDAAPRTARAEAARLR